MKWHLIAVGKPALTYARDAIANYHKRLRHYTPTDITYVRDGRQDDVEKRLLAASENHFRIVLDERGSTFTTQEFVKKIDGWELRGTKSIALLIGGSDGHTQTLRDRADLIFSLTPLTLQHELALIVLLEQLYRAYTIKRGEPYHR